MLKSTNVSLRLIDRTFSALSDPHRRHVIELLRERPHRAGELAEAVGLSAPAMSRHLKTLRESRLVEETPAEFDTRVRIYRLRPQPMAHLKAWIEETERLWTEQLSGLKAYLEGESE